jgi:thiopeptide-type bacteriocin biosynthesis protein
MPDTRELSSDEQLCGVLRDYINLKWDPDAAGRNLGEAVESAASAVNRIVQEHAESERWLYFRLGVKPNGQTRPTLARTVPLLSRLRLKYPIEGWWWLNKRDIEGPAVRLRIRIPAFAGREVADVAEAELRSLNLQITPLRYEPEICLFGGAAGLRLAHRFMCADSEFLAGWMQGEDSERQLLIPEGLSVAIVSRLLAASGLDLFESWDVFDRVCDKRSSKNVSQEAILTFRKFAQKILGNGHNKVFALYSGNHATLLQDYGDFLDSFGRDLQHAYFQGQLECGMREFLVPCILFHWNRTGMSPVIQAALANATAAELASVSRKGSTPAPVEVAAS